MGMCGFPSVFLRQDHRSPLRKCQARKPFLECGGLASLPRALGLLAKKCVVKSMSYPRWRAILTATIRTRRAVPNKIAKTSRLSSPSVETLICARQQFTQ
jgi:hypothetical protein